MQKFSDFIKEHKAVLENNVNASKVEKFNSLYEAKLKEFNAKSILDLTEEQLDQFNSYIKTLKEEIKKTDSKKIAKEDGKVNEKDVTDEKSFREYAEAVLKKAHPDDYDEKIANKVIDGLISKVKDDDWGSAIGRLTSSLGK